ncbi:hypothetical protein QBC35DRAFT_221243 [Podospora australis]|uniref:Secreted protein n=1 Tax=Podospora australis TaxID=1536484 RepID=A0AAN6WUH8_9PEZI|nr:hypothetical protein QBC35DRAFT_221243 [Podospora australis]
MASSFLPLFASAVVALFSWRTNAISVDSKPADMDLWGVSAANLTKYFDHPNATGIYHLHAPDISIAYADRRQFRDDWSLSIAVVADIPLDERAWATKEQRADRSFTGTKLTLQAPPRNSDNSSAAHISWTVCLIEYSPYFKKDVSALRRPNDDDNNSCSSILSQECIAAMEEDAIKKYTGSSPDFPCHCPSTDKLPACEGQMRWSGGCSARRHNATEINTQWLDGKYDWRFIGGDRTERGNITAYNELGSIAWPTIVLWGQSPNATTGGQGVRVNNTAKMVCMRAKNATQGSIAPATSGGRRNTVSTVTAGFVWIAIWMMLM